ncbi:MAG: zinc ribbon-containing protein [Firmicutes bacterium]|nr:zinc ribbon-containing protein [Bacillota bacterium]
MVCDKCGKEIHNKAVVCPYCHASTPNPVPNASYQPMSGFFLSFLIAPIGFFVSLVQFFRALKRKGLWLFPLFGIIISLTITITVVVLALAWGALVMELLRGAA